MAVTTELSDTKIRFTIGSVVLTSKLIDGTFPDYQRVIPTGNDKKLVIDRQSFAAAVDRVSTISSERGRAVKLSIGRWPGDARRQQSGFRQRHRGTARPTIPPTRSRSASTPATCSMSRRSFPAARRASCWPTPARRR